MTTLSILLLSLIDLLAMGSNTAELTFAGDAMQHGPQIAAAHRSNGTYDYSSCFSLLEPQIKHADFAVVNLECPLAGKPYSGYPHFSAPAAFAGQLKKSGFDLQLTANNHCLDCGDAGLVHTIASLYRMKIRHIGTYVDALHRKAQIPYIVNVKGIKMAFLNYTFGTNGIEVKGDAIVNYIDKEQIARDIDDSRAAGAQMVCVCAHWGIEYHSQPSKGQQGLADFLTAKGVDLIIGSHPHVVQPMMMRYNAGYDKNTLLVYSLGNFISNQNGDDSRGGAMVKVHITQYAGVPVIMDASCGLFFCQKPASTGENYRLIPANMPEKVRSDSRNAFNLMVGNASKLFRENNHDVPLSF